MIGLPMKIKDSSQPIKHLSFVSVLATTLIIGGGVISCAQVSPQGNASPGIKSPDAVTQSGSTDSYIGKFVKGEAPTSGTVRVVTKDQHRFLEIDDAFKTTDQAPDLHVILEPSDTPPKSYTNPGQFINLGKLQKVSGVQSYPIPDVIDVTSYKSVVIWCRMANATIGYAQLKSEASASQ
jgi:hypothetical protein